jgi:aminobenzoyl-glutamate utilization protein B
MLPHRAAGRSARRSDRGQATADNLPAGLAEINILRVPTLEMAEQVTAVLDRNAAGPPP